MELKNLYEYFNFKDFPFMLSNFFILALVFTFLTILQRVLPWYNLWKKGPPGPIGLPFVGYLFFLGREPHKTFWNLRKKYGDVISVYLGRKYTIILNDYKAMKEVFNHPASVDRPTDLFKHIGPAGFAVENGERWVEQRKFSMSALRELGFGKDNWGDLVMEELSSLKKKFQELKGKPHDISDYLLHSLNTSILSLLIGRGLNSEETDTIYIASKYAEAALDTAAPSNPLLLIPGLRKAFEVLKIAGLHKDKTIIDKFHLFLKGEIEKHKTSPHLRDIPDFINSYLEKIMDLSKTNNKDHSFSELMLQGNLSILFLGGSDTVFSSLGYLLRVMSKYKKIQNKVYMEVMEVLGKDGQARYDERDRIPYTFAVVMEGQRSLSNLPLTTTRHVNQDISYNGYIIPKGSDIMGNLWGLHHDPDYWDKPEEFRPERFLTDGGTKLIKNPPSFAPFSFGKRNCPGEIIAWKEMLFYFTEIIKNFEILPPPGEESKFELSKALVRRIIPQPLCFKERKLYKLYCCKSDVDCP